MGKSLAHSWQTNLHPTRIARKNTSTSSNRIAIQCYSLPTRYWSGGWCNYLRIYISSDLQLICSADSASRNSLSNAWRGFGELQQGIEGWAKLFRSTQQYDWRKSRAFLSAHSNSFTCPHSCGWRIKNAAANHLCAVASLGDLNLFFFLICVGFGKRKTMKLDTLFHALFWLIVMIRVRVSLLSYNYCVFGNMLMFHPGLLLLSQIISRAVVKVVIPTDRYVNKRSSLIKKIPWCCVACSLRAL